MKKQLLFFMLSAVMLAAGGCSKEDGNANLPDGFGKLSLGMKLDAQITETRATPTASDFKLTITGDQTNRTWTNIAAYQAADTLFKIGTYTTTITYGDPDTEGVDAAYYTASKDATVEARKTTTVSLTAKPAKAQTVVRATASFLKYFHDASFTVKTGSNNTFTFTPTAAGDGTPVWVKAATKLTVNGTAKKQSNGQDPEKTVTFAEQTLAATTAATCHIFVFDAQNAGSATLTITMGDGSIVTYTYDFELNDAAKE